MSVEAASVAEKADENDPAERRARNERRGRDRRKPGTRINMTAPRRSLLRLSGAVGSATSAAILVFTLLVQELFSTPVPATVWAFEMAAVATSIILLGMGAIESRLIEIRLELLMLNGGGRKEDRRGGDRRG